MKKPTKAPGKPPIRALVKDCRIQIEGLGEVHFPGMVWRMDYLQGNARAVAVTMTGTAATGYKITEQFTFTPDPGAGDWEAQALAHAQARETWRGAELAELADPETAG
ncbi:MAG TPA: hypothetical protein PKD10_18415 [Paracoccaceae bacterium]|nr:hypothetical protein [Paracoccaceae bacterium]HMO71102.1 hypothetical protein [Paracoccaceae bacterium]